MKRIIGYAVLVAQIVGLGALYAWHASALSLPGYLLKAHRSDPRDLLRGDYIILSYDISDLPKNIKTKEDLPEEVYGILEQKGKFWELARVQAELPTSGEVYLAAKYRYGRLIYGIENYYVPEGKGNPTGDITVEICIRAGHAQIKKVYVDGRPWP